MNNILIDERNDSLRWLACYNMLQNVDVILHDTSVFELAGTPLLWVNFKALSKEVVATY